MALSADQQKQLGHKLGPLSKANLVFETQTLKTGSEDHVVVFVSLNPLTYDIVKANLKHFEDDKITELLIKDATLLKDGTYMIKTFEKELTSPAIAEQAHAVLAACQESILAMHEFVMGILSIKE